MHWACTSFVLSTSYSCVDLAFWSLHIWFCECWAAWISSACFHCALLLSRFVLSCQICLWWFLSLPSFSSECCSTRTVICVDKKWFKLHGFPIWMSLFGSQDPEKEQFVMPRILIEISDNFPRAWSGIVATSLRIWEIWIFCRLLLDHGGLTL